MAKGLMKWCRQKRVQRKAANRLRHGCRMRFANAATSRFCRIPFGDGSQRGRSGVVCPHRATSPLGDKPPGSGRSGPTPLYQIFWHVVLDKTAKY